VITITRYRRKNGSDIWHWCKNCSNWPESDFEEIYFKPVSGEFDNECKALEKEGKCAKKLLKF
jgi:hypothetical protein